MPEAQAQVAGQALGILDQRPVHVEAVDEQPLGVEHHFFRFNASEGLEDQPSAPPQKTSPSISGTFRVMRARGSPSTI